MLPRRQRSEITSIVNTGATHPFRTVGVMQLHRQVLDDALITFSSSTRMREA